MLPPFSRGILINIDVFCCCYPATAYCERLLVIVSDILEFLFLHFATGLKEVIDIHGCNAIQKAFCSWSVGASDGNPIALYAGLATPPNQTHIDGQDLGQIFGGALGFFWAFPGLV